MLRNSIFSFSIAATMLVSSCSAYAVEKPPVFQEKSRIYRFLPELETIGLIFGSIFLASCAYDKTYLTDEIRAQMWDINDVARYSVQRLSDQYGRSDLARTAAIGTLCACLVGIALVKYITKKHFAARKVDKVQPDIL